MLREECLRFQEERRERAGALRLELMQIEERGPGGEEAREARRDYEGYLATSKRLMLRGWEVLLLPAPAPPPPARDYLVALEVDPSTRLDRPEIKGVMRVWIAPRGWLARLFA